MTNDANFESQAKELILKSAEHSGLTKKVAALLSRGVAETTIPWLIDIFDGINIPASFNEWANSIGGYTPYAYEPPQMTPVEYAAYLINHRWDGANWEHLCGLLKEAHPEADIEATMRAGVGLIAAPDPLLLAAARLD